MHKQTTHYLVGIDLGTTHTVVARSESLLMPNREHLMKQQYLQSLIDVAKKELGIYKLYAQDFGLINTLFIKKAFSDNNTNLLIQIEDTKKLYLSVISASFLLMYEKNYQQNVEIEFEIGDKIYWKPRYKTYLVTEKNTERYTLKHEYDEKNILGQVDHQMETCQPRIKDCRKDYIKVNRDTHKRDSFEKLLCFLYKHLKINQLLVDFPYKIAIVCCKDELIKDLRNTDWHKAIPYRYLTKDGKEEDNLPIEPLIYIASDYQTIREHIFDKDEKLKTVIFFDKYNDAEKISKDIREGQLKKCIFIGEDDLQFKHDSLLTWRWTPEEFNYFHQNDYPLAKINPVYVENSQLLIAINKFLTDIEEIEGLYTVQFPSLKFYAKKALLVVIPEASDLLVQEVLQEKFVTDCEEALFNELYAAVGIEKEDIDIYSKTFQNSYQDVIEHINASNNAKANKIAVVDFDYLIVSPEYKDSWQQVTDKNVLTYSEWKRNKDKNKKVLFLGLYGYSHYQTMKNSCDNISILIYANSQEQKALEAYQNKYDLELEDEYHSNDRKILSGKTYPIPKRERITHTTAFFEDIEKDGDGDIVENQRNYQKEETLLKYSFNDGTSEILPISRHVLIQQGELLISEKLENVKVGDELRIYHNFNKDKLEEIATPKQKQAIFECKKCAELWKRPLLNFYRLNYYTKEKLLADLQSKGADITHINTLNKWLDMNDKMLFPSKAKNIIAISELINDDKLKENLKEISKSRTLYRSIMIALGRDFSDAISLYITNNERTHLLKSFSDEKIQKMLKENIPVKKLIKITEPNAKEQFEQVSIIFEDTNLIDNNENHHLIREEDNMTNEEFQELIQESEDLVEQAKEQADSLDESMDNLESDISNKLDSVIAENLQLRKEVDKLKENLQEAESKIYSLATMQKKHHEAIKYLIDSFKKLNSKVDNIRTALK